MVLALILLSSSAAVAAPPAPKAVLIVRVDDRALRRLRSPWITTTLADGTAIAVAAGDDGAEPADTFPGDHIWFARLEVATAGRLDLVLRDGEATALPLNHQLVQVLPGKEQLVPLSDRVRVLAPTATRQTPADAAAEDDDDLVAVEATQVAPTIPLARWPQGPRLTAAAIGATLLASLAAARRLGRHLLALGAALEATIDGIGASRPAPP